MSSDFRLAMVLGLLAGDLLHAQCETRAKTGEPAPGPRGQTTIVAVASWDPDGAGPRAQVLVCGGTFTIPSIGASNLATWDPATRAWGAFAAQPDFGVRAIAVLPSGELVIGGNFTAIGGAPASRIAIWNGSAWSSPGGGVTTSAYGGVTALQLLPNGDLVAAGSFTAAGGVPAPGLARWDGSQWHAIGALAGSVSAVTVRPNGNLVAGGVFQPYGNPGYATIAEWNGASWWYGPPLSGPYSTIQAVAVLTGGDVVASGSFVLPGMPLNHHVARWDGTAWTALGAGLDGNPRVLWPLPNDQLLAASITSINLVPVLGVARWDGSQWLSHAPNIGLVLAVAWLPNGNLVAAGSLAVPSGEPLRGLATWDGSAWHAPAAGFDGDVDGFVPLPNGDLVAFGTFTCAEGAGVGGLARRSGTGWWPMTPAGSATPWWGNPTCGTVDGTGTLWMAGASQGTGGGLGGNIGRWTGSSWQTVGIACGAVTSIVVPPDGRPIVGGLAPLLYTGQAVLRWNGTQWVGYGAGLDGPVRTLLRRQNGDLIAGGEFMNSGSTLLSRIARWDGTAWQPLGNGVDGPVRALAELHNGDLIAAGDFVTDSTRPLNLVARWDGAAWQPLGAGLGGNPGVSVRSLHVLPDGDLLAGGDFLTASGYAVRGLARWDGTRWHAVDGDVDGTVLAIAQLPDGELVIGGNFATVGGRHAAHFARLRSTCPALAQPYGAACAGSGGPLALEAASLPWLGSTYRAVCYGVAPGGIGLAVLGLVRTQLPLATLHPAAGPGCLLSTNVDVAVLRLPVAGAITSALAVPRANALVGTVLHHQVLVGELSAQALALLASSNALALTVGVF